MKKPIIICGTCGKKICVCPKPEAIAAPIDLNKTQPIAPAVITFLADALRLYMLTLRK